MPPKIPEEKELRKRSTAAAGLGKTVAGKSVLTPTLPLL